MKIVLPTLELQKTCVSEIAESNASLKFPGTYTWSLILMMSLFVALFLPAKVEAQSWYSASWNYRKAITIDFTKVGTGPHTNFPVLINITDANLQAGALSTGNDILFTSSDGITKLPHEIESYTSATGALVAWVTIPSLSSTANTVIYMYYGDAAATSQQNVTGTWDATFKGVYHLNNSFLDATLNNHDGTNTGTIAATGKISGGRGYVRSNGTDYVTITGLMGSPTTFTLSAWENLTTADPNGADIISLGDNSVLRCDEVSANKTCGVAYTSSGAWSTTGSGINYAGTGWHYIVYTFDNTGNSQKVYVDGAQVATSSVSSTPLYTSGGTNTFIGKHGNGNANMDFDGTIDEARVAGASRSAGWVLTEYHNQNSPATFYSEGAETCNTPVASGTSTVTCVGGSTGTITASATGGVSPYTYSLNAGTYQASVTFTGLAAGTYTVNAKSTSGCVGSTSVIVSPYANSPDDQNATATNSWIGHMYTGLAFTNYIGHFTETETFDELFGGSGNCFNVVSSSVTRSIYTDVFSVKYRMNSTKKGLYVVDLGSDDGSRLTVDGTMVYNNWSDQSMTTKPSVLTNLNGASSLLYEFYENGGSNEVKFQNLTLVLANTLSTNTAQNICLGNAGSAISGDVYGTLPTGITLSGTGYQWSYSTTAGGARTNISGATAATFTPSTAAAPFNALGTFYIYRNAVLSSVNNIAPVPYVTTNESIAATITVSTPPSATISYAGNPYCFNAGTASVTRTGTTGGTYSSTAGLTINGASGDITLSSCTPGTYTVTYTMVSTGCTTTASASVTVTAVPSATFSYPGSPYMANAGTATVTFSGTAGGTYSSTAGLSVNAASGAVTLATSTLGTYTVTYTVAAAGGCSLYSTTANITVVISTKTFTGTGNFSDPTKWTSGTLPATGENLIIDGACTVDNNVGTDNIAYGTLTIGTATGRTLNWATSGTNRLNVSSVSSGPGTSTLDMTNGGTLITRGSFSPTNLLFTPGSGTIEIQSSISLPAYPTFSNLKINGSGITLSLGAAIILTGNLTLTAGTLNANNFGVTIGGNWINNVSTTGFTAGTAGVTFNTATVQSIGGSFATTFNNLTIAKTSGAVTLNVNTSIAGNLSVTTGTFDLGAFTANRASVGGILTVSNTATLKIGGTNTFPSNYSTNTLVVAGTVEYSGTSQTVSNQAYGNLTLSSSSGAAIKTFPATAMAVTGNLTSTLGAGTSVSFTAAAIITVNGNVSIGASTTFNGSSYANSIVGNWVNNGTFTGSTGTITLTGSGTSVSGSGAQNFNNLTIAASAITFSATTVSLSGNLATTGSGSFSQASGGTLSMSGSGKTISGTGITLDNLTVGGTVSTSISLILTGNLSVGGTFTSSGTVTMSGAAKTMSGAGTSSFSILSISGSITTATSFSIASSLGVSGSFSASAGTATFTGTSTLNGTANLFNTTINGTSLQLSSNSVLGIANVFTITAGSLNVTSSVPNTVNFNGTGAQNINAMTYCNLVLSNGNTKTASGAITTNYNITIGAGTIFNASTYTYSIYGNWINSGTFTSGTSTVQFLGSATGYVTGVTAFNILTSNTSSTTTQLILNNNVSAAIVNMTNGIITTGSNTLTITNTRTGNGYIYGNIQRTHSFTTGVAYAFEGPYNTVTFSSVSSVTSITVSVVEGSIVDFPFGGSISRMYNITVPAGTYNATLRLHFEHDELNGNDQSSMALWNYSGSAWTAIGKTANDTVANYVEKSGLTNITNRWTLSDDANIVQWNGSVSTDWNTAANWTVLQGSASKPPAATDIVNLGTIAFTNQPVISTAVSVKNINFGSTQAVTLSMAAGGSLISGDIQGDWTSNATHTINANNQTITINGDLDLSDGVNGQAINLNIGSGTVNVIDALTQSGGANITFSSTGNLNIGEDYIYAGGTFTPGAGTVTYNGTNAQVIGAVNYNNLTINNAAAVVSIDSNFIIGGNLSVIAGELDNSALLNISGDVNISTGATIHNSGILHVGGNWNKTGNYVGTGAHILFNGTGTQTITATTFTNIIINKPVGSSAVLTGNIILNGDLTVTSGTLNIKSFTCDRIIAGGTITLSDSATFIVGANNAPALFSTGIISNSSTVIADGTSPQNIYSGTNFGNLILRNAGTKTLVTPLTVNGNLTIESGATFDGSSQTITLNGNWINSGTFTPSTSTLVLSGIGKTVTGNTTFNLVTIPGSYTNLSNITYNDLLHITSTGSISSSTGIFTTMNGDLINNGILYTLGTTTFTGNVVQTLSLINAVQTVALIVNFNGTVSPVLHSTSVPQYGYLTINNTGGVNPSVGWTILYNLTVGSGASFNGGVSTHTITGPVTNNGIITSNGILNFLPASAAAINLGSHFSSTGTVNFGGTGAMTLAGTTDSFHNVVISNTNAAGIAPSSGWVISNNLTVNSSSILNGGSYNYLIGGQISDSGTVNSGTSTFTLNGAVSQNIYAVSPFNNLTINKPAGLTTLSSNATVNNVLNFVAGTIQTGNNAVISPSTGTITGAAQGTGWVNGNLQKNIATGATAKTFETGDSANYTPVSLSFASVTTAGNLTAFTTKGDHPNISGSVINAAKSLNRFWTLINSGVAFTNYNATYNFAAADIDAGANTAAFNVANYNASSWSLPVTASPNPTNIQATGVTSFGDFAVGEICNKGTTISYASSPYCNSGTATATLTGTPGGVYSSTAGLTINASTGNIDLNTITLGTYIVTYTIPSAGSCAQYQTMASVTIVTPGTWSGAISTAWNTSGNWICGGIPTSTTNVTIPGSLSNYPVLNTGTGSIQNITILTGASLTVTGATLQIAGSISNSGTFTATNGTIEFNGSSVQTIPAAAFAGNKIKNLVISNDLILAGQDSVTGILSFGNVNSKTITTGGYLTFKSTATGTACLADITNNSVNSGNTISGNVTVERYLSSLNNRAYRLLGPSVITASSIHANWQEGAASNLDNPNPGYGLHITGSSADQTNGFDATTTAQGSLYTYNQVTSAWVTAPNTNVAVLNALTGYLLYVRGDRSINLGAQYGTLPTNNTTLRATGTLLTGTQTFNGLAGNSNFSLITNPFASSINWATVQSAATGINNAYSFWDPNFGTRGGFVTVNTSGVASSGNATQNIQSGQAFFVQASGASSPSVTVRETDKSSTNNIDLFGVTYPAQTFSTSLYFTQVDGTPRIADGVVTVYNNNYSASVDGDDAQEINNWDENIAIAREGKHLSIESRPVIIANDTLPLFMNNMKVRDYSFVFAPSNLSLPGTSAELIDNFTRTRTNISLTDSTTIPFTVSAVAGSNATDRFYIVFTPLKVLPVTLTNLKAYQQGANIAVEWKVENELNMKQYEVERSGDGINFTKMNAMLATGSPSYNWLDVNPAKGNNFYRIKSIDVDGHSTYSTVVNVIISKGKQSITIYPNPVENKVISLFMENMPKGIYYLEVINNLGQVMAKKTISHAEGNSVEIITPGKNIPAGTYLLEITKPDSNKMTSKFSVR